MGQEIQMLSTTEFWRVKGEGVRVLVRKHTDWTAGDEVWSVYEVDEQDARTRTLADTEARQFVRIIKERLEGR